MTPYGYHNSEISRMNGDDRRNVREAMRQAKLVRQKAHEGAAGIEFEGSATRSGVWHRLLGWARQSTPRTYLRHPRAHSQ